MSANSKFQNISFSVVLILSLSVLFNCGTSDGDNFFGSTVASNTTGDDTLAVDDTVKMSSQLEETSSSSFSEVIIPSSSDSEAAASSSSSVDPEPPKSSSSSSPSYSSSESFPIMVGDIHAIETREYDGETLYLLPNLTDEESKQAYRYLAMVTGSEPASNGHPGLTEDGKRSILKNLATVVHKLVLDYGGLEIVAGDDSLSFFEAYTAKALGSVLYRPFYAESQNLDDEYGKNWSMNLDSLVMKAGGISEDVVQFMLVRADNGQAIAPNQSGALETFYGFGDFYQPYGMRNEDRFKRTNTWLQNALNNYQ